MLNWITVKVMLPCFCTVSAVLAALQAAVKAGKVLLVRLLYGWALQAIQAIQQSPKVG